MIHPVALITGAARRIGAEIARTLHASGYNIIVHYRSSNTAANELVRELNAARPNSAESLAADLNAVEQVKHLAEQSLALWGRMDVLVNNASNFYPTPLHSADETQWNDLLGSNLKAPFFLTQALAEALKQNSGCVINIADIFGMRPMANHSIYSIAKAGNIMLTKSLALELAPNVRVNGIAPGAMLWPEDEQGQLRENPDALKKIPTGSLGGAQSIADTVLFLTRKNSYITGQVLCVDGGRSLRQ